MENEEIQLLDKILKDASIRAYEIPVYTSLCSKLRDMLFPKESQE